MTEKNQHCFKTNKYKRRRLELFPGFHFSTNKLSTKFSTQKNKFYFVADDERKRLFFSLNLIFFLIWFIDKKILTARSTLMNLEKVLCTIESEYNFQPQFDRKKIDREAYWRYLSLKFKVEWTWKLFYLLEIRTFRFYRPFKSTLL